MVSGTPLNKTHFKKTIGLVPLNVTICVLCLKTKLTASRHANLTEQLRQSYFNDSEDLQTR